MADVGNTLSPRVDAVLDHVANPRPVDSFPRGKTAKEQNAAIKRWCRRCAHVDPLLANVRNTRRFERHASLVFASGSRQHRLFRIWELPPARENVRGSGDIFAPWEADAIESAPSGSSGHGDASPAPDMITSAGTRTESLRVKARHLTSTAGAHPAPPLDVERSAAVAAAASTMRSDGEGKRAPGRGYGRETAASGARRSPDVLHPIAVGAPDGPCLAARGGAAGAVEAKNSCVERSAAEAAARRATSARKRRRGYVLASPLPVLTVLGMESAERAAREARAPFLGTDGCAALVDRFDVLNVVGHGSYGVCRRVREMETGAMHAAKVVRKRLLATAAERTAVCREIGIHRTLRHPNVVPLLDAFETADTYQLVMELAPWGDLDTFRRKQRGGVVDEETARCVFRQVLHALVFLHDRNIVHCDVKPQNVLLFPPAARRTGPSPRHTGHPSPALGGAAPQQRRPLPSLPSSLSLSALDPDPVAAPAASRARTAAPEGKEDARSSGPRSAGTIRSAGTGSHTSADASPVPGPCSARICTAGPATIVSRPSSSSASRGTPATADTPARAPASACSSARRSASVPSTAGRAQRWAERGSHAGCAGNCGDTVGVKLCDFGNAVARTDPRYIPVTGRVDRIPFVCVTGTQGYMAPEIFSRQAFSGAVDMWSAGILLYELLAGFSPFYPPSQCVHEDAPFPKREWKSVSPSAQDLVRRLLTRDPNHRPTPGAALRHPWLADDDDLGSPEAGSDAGSGLYETDCP